MLTPRALVVLFGAVLLYVASRAVGAPELHIASVGLLSLVAVAAIVARLRASDLQVGRRLSTRRAFPGTRLEVTLEVRNRARGRTVLLLLEDRLPVSLGTSARAILPALPGGGAASVAYHVTARARGRYEIGPATVSLADPFDLTRSKIRFADRHELIVYPEVEELEGTPGAARSGGSGDSASRQVFRTGAEFYTMREYQTGDDLRRIHWPSTARRDKLMIRQDETARRATAVVLLDTRAEVLGVEPAAFERAVSAAASVGMLFARMGATLRLVTPGAAPRTVTTDQFLEALAVMGPSGAGVLGPTLEHLARGAGDQASLIVVTYAPAPEEIAAITRAGAGFDTRLAILVWPRSPGHSRERTQVEARVDAGRASFARAGWTVMPVRPHGRLRDAWRLDGNRATRIRAASS